MKWLCIFCIFCMNTLFANDQAIIEKALGAYQKAEKAENLREQKKWFTKALELYLQIEPAHPSKELSFNIANTYFQLGEYGFAIYYYTIALQQAPRNELILRNIDIAKRQAGITQQERPFFERLARLNDMVSLEEQELLLIAMLAFGVVFYSFYLWTKIQPFKKLLIFSLLFAFLFLSTTIYSRYLRLPEGVFIRAAYIKIAPGEPYAPIENGLVSAGEALKVLDVLKNGSWIQVKLLDDREGYVAKEQVRILPEQ